MLTQAVVSGQSLVARKIQNPLQNPQLDVAVEFKKRARMGHPSITVSALSRDTWTGRKVLTFPFVEGFGVAFAFAHATKARLRILRWNFGSPTIYPVTPLPTMIRCSDSPTCSGRQGAQSGQRCLTGPPGCPSGCLACEPAAHNWPGRAASSTSVPPTFSPSRPWPRHCPGAASGADSHAVTRCPTAPPCGRPLPAASASSGCLASKSPPVAADRPKSVRADSAPGNSPPAGCARTALLAPASARTLEKLPVLLPDMRHQQSG